MSFIYLFISYKYYNKNFIKFQIKFLVGTEGLEPSTPALKVRCSNPTELRPQNSGRVEQVPLLLSITSIFYASQHSPYVIRVPRCGMTDSNRRPSACKAPALPAELIPPKLFVITQVATLGVYGLIEVLTTQKLR